MKSRYVGSLMAGAALIAFAQPAIAQTPSGDELPENTEDLAAPETIVVTGTRLRSAGFDAPTPVSVVGEELLEDRGATNVANIINELPAFTGTLTPSSTKLNSRQNGVNAVDLRGLGTNRNLVLLNGRRGTPFDEFANVDLNSVPSLAIARVEVVTGGASAAYGSDAVSGVVNLIYDTELEGFKFNAQYGQTDENDANDYRLAAAYGADLGGGQGHLLVAADYNKNTGIPFGKDRAWQRESPVRFVNPDNTGPDDGIPAFIFAKDAVLFVGSPNGVTLPGGAAGNLEFFPDGTARDRELGVIGGNFMLGGSGSRLGDNTALFIPVERFNVLAAAEYDVGGGVRVFSELSYAQSETEGALIDGFSLGGVTIQPDNPYLPDDVAALDTPFALFRTFSEVGPITSISKNRNFRAVVGVEGEIGDLWTWDVSGVYGQNRYENDQINNLIPPRLSLAADAVVDPNSGDIVCRANLGGANGAPGCVPINLFGQGSPSAAALGYVIGRGESYTEINQYIASANVSGELFTNWAGPVLASFGAEYRDESLDREVSALNESSSFVIVNSQPLRGKFDVKEIYGELGVPLLSGDQSLELNAAGRYTDYSTVGGVETWKVGLTYSPIDILRFRGTISRDIRAPSIGESFVESILLFSTITNPFTGEEEFIETPTVGNLNLTEESALTKTLGAVLTVGGLRTSVDWYNIDLDDAISPLGPQSVVNRCFAGETALCDNIQFGADQSIVRIPSQNLNLGTFEVEGVDVEARYTTNLGAGRINLGAIGSYLISKKIAPTGGVAEDVAGEVGGENVGGLPDLRATFSAGYDADMWGVYAQLRYISDGKYNNQFGPEQLSDADNNIGDVSYVDISAKYDLADMVGQQVELYGGIDNLFDRDPPLVPSTFISNSATNAGIYDVIGRKFYVGVRGTF
jgi:outer membrane receptor protein involved in Fe transport|tara:strand:+ start:36138 stop:38891 length:2754 start_codon:yes stop_codon:yes gene_type:complete